MKKVDLRQFEDLISAREKQLSVSKNTPNKMELVGLLNNSAILNNASSTDFEAALEAISAVKEQVVWITELDYVAINFHGILGGLLERLDMIIHVGKNNPLESLGKGAVSCETIEEAVELGLKNLQNRAYLVYAPANQPADSVKERGDLFRNLITEKLK